MTNLRLDHAVEHYQDAIATLEAAGQQLSTEQILEALLARDRVQAALTDTTQSNPGRLIVKVYQLDNRLKKQAESLNPGVNWSNWREMINPPESHWWWLLGSPEPTPWYKRFDWLWIWLSLVFLTASISLTVDLADRLLSGDPSRWGTLGVVAQSVITLLTAGGALTKTGREGIEHFLNTVRIPEHFWDESICALSVLVFLIPMFVQSQLPNIAEYYKNLGDAAYCVERIECAPQLASAERYYSRAIKIDPDDTEAYYKLGRLFEDLQDFDGAINQYQIAVKGTVQGVSYQAYNRLARLYILNGTPEGYSNAISLLNRALGLAPVKRDTETLYAIHKNFGWARLEQGRYIEARNKLDKAIELFPDQAPAHCLLAQALENLPDDSRDSLKEWEHCLQYANQKDPDEDAWIGLAVQRLEDHGYRQ